jgi:hypothetical protein
MDHKTVISLAFVTFQCAAQPNNDQPRSSFNANVQAEWLDLEGGPVETKSGRDMKLLRDLTYVDSGGTKWHVPAGAVVNGASIPMPLWKAVGSPYVGKYRSASVVHDYYCRTRGLDTATQTRRTSTQVHKMFGDAMRASGVSTARAVVMEQAVLRCGPQWNTSTGEPLHTVPCTPVQYREYGRQLATLLSLGQTGE